MSYWRLLLALALWIVSAVLWTPVISYLAGRVEAISGSRGDLFLLLVFPASAMIASVWGLWHLRRA